MPASAAGCVVAGTNLEAVAETLISVGSEPQPCSRTDGDNVRLLFISL
jgi:hypothetical protein